MSISASIGPQTARRWRKISIGAGSDKVAAEMKVVTQMGNNGHGGEVLRRTKEWIDAGANGDVQEVHVWSDRPGTFGDSQGKRRATDTPIKLT